MRLAVRGAWLAAVAALLAACAPEPPASPIRVSHPIELAGTAWTLVSIQDRPPTAGPAVTLEFADGRVSGNGSCNSFGGSFTYDPATGALRIGDLVSTKRACVDAARNDLEGAYLTALRGAADASIDAAGRLVITGATAPLVLDVFGQPVGPPPSFPDPGPS